MSGLLECVINVAEGRDRKLLETLARAAKPTLLDIHADRDHHRAVFTLGGTPDEVVASVKDFAKEIVHLDLSLHEGIHPRIGVLDVVPFIDLDDLYSGVAITKATEFGKWWSDEFGVPVFLYDLASDNRTSLPEIRANAFAGITQDFGPDHPHATLGATAVGARQPLVAINLLLDTPELAIAQETARELRASSGGLPGVRALGFYVATYDRAQLSMNLVDLHTTNTEVACTAAQECFKRRGAQVQEVELVGLVPGKEFSAWSDAFRKWSGIREDHTIGWRLQHRPDPDQIEWY